MFKRLTKARRHSADEIGGAAVLPLDEPPPPPTNGQHQQQQQQQQQHRQPATSSIQQATAGAAAYVISARNKFTRKSCGDAYALLAAEDDGLPRATMKPAGAGKAQQEADYRLVTAVPAFIVEHEAEKQRGLGGVWGLRRVSKKIDSFRRSSSRETICTIPERPDSKSLNNNNNNLDSTNNNRDTNLSPNSNEKKSPGDRRLFNNSSRSPSPFKSFFIRMGSTGMLNSSSKSRRSSQNLEGKLNGTPEKENLFRSCSTSQLNTSPTYVKGDDPSEGIDLRITAKNEHGKTVSCDNLSGRQPEDDMFDGTLSSRSSIASSRSFVPCDFSDPTRGDFMKKSNSCDLKEVKKTNFPYAFLRSKLSVLPEERNYNGTSSGLNSGVGKEERLFKTASEEHFPAMKIEDTFDGTTTLGRRRPSKNAYANRDSHRYRLQDQSNRYARNSYSEFKEDQFQRYDQKDRYFGPVNLAMMHNNLDENCRNSISLPYQGSGAFQDRQDIMHYRSDATTSLNPDLIYESNATTTTTTSTPGMMTSALLRHHRRNSAPSGEQRLSSHYVSSNESGYDSDGPRGESAASEAEALSLKCTDSSDTSSVVDSELEKPMRSSTPSECQEQDNKDITKLGSMAYLDEREEASDVIDGLRWHQQSASGRFLPSIHQSNSPSSPSSSLSSSTSSSNSMSALIPKGIDALGIQSSAHRVRLQQDKTRFLSDIIQPPKRVRRCRMVQLTKANPKESLGIRLAQQRVGEIRYVIVQLETDGIAHRDGRLRLGDEIVEVEGKDLRALSSLDEVQDFLRSCEGSKVRLKTAYEETMPQLYPDNSNGSETECQENERTLSSVTLVGDGDEQEAEEGPSNGRQKRPDYLALDSSATSSDLSTSSSSSSGVSAAAAAGGPSVAAGPPYHHLGHQHQLQCATRHVARFEKGLGKPSLGFSVVGGRDSPRGEMGIYVRRVFPGGQADLSKALFQGDEILSLNGKILKGCTHQEVIEQFKAVREGPVELELARRHRYHKVPPLKTAPY